MWLFYWRGTIESRLIRAREEKRRRRGTRRGVKVPEIVCVQVHFPPGSKWWSIFYLSNPVWVLCGVPSEAKVQKPSVSKEWSKKCVIDGKRVKMIAKGEMFRRPIATPGRYRHWQEWTPLDHGQDLPVARRFTRNSADMTVILTVMCFVLLMPIAGLGWWVLVTFFGLLYLLPLPTFVFSLVACDGDFVGYNLLDDNELALCSVH